MNVGLILLVLSALKATARWPWYALAGTALAVLSLEWQALSTLRWTVSISGLAFMHAAVLGLLLFRAEARKRLVTRLTAMLAAMRAQFYALGVARSRARRGSPWR